jgi:outer membrane protein assembly factor BamD (BamD/ComL family)
MKRTERHHLKDNELVNVAFNASRAFQERKSLMTTLLVAALVLAVAALGYRWWTGRADLRAQVLLSEAVVTEETPVGPPEPDAPQGQRRFGTERERNESALKQLNAVWEQYPSTEAGMLARYRAAGTLLALGRPQEAITAYQDVVNRSGTGIYGDMSRLGLAEAQVQAGEHDKAITTFKELSERKDGHLPVEGILMQLGRTYRSAGRQDDAQQTFTRIVEEFPNSPFTDEAKRELESLKKT